MEEGVNDKLLGIMMAGGYTGIAYSAFVFVVTFESQANTHTHAHLATVYPMVQVLALTALTLSPTLSHTLILTFVACPPTPTQGKVVFGLLTDRWGGRFALFTCLLMTPLLSALLALGSSYGWFFVAWLCLRFFQASGWIGLVKLAGGWVPYHRQGRVMGFLSLSMLAGKPRHTRKKAANLGFGRAHSPMPCCRRLSGA